MNPAALVTNFSDLERGGILIVNEDSFNDKELRAGRTLPRNPLEDGIRWTKYRVFRVPMTTLTRKAVEELGLSVKIADRCRNFFAMGLVYWLYGRDFDADVAVHPRQVRQQTGHCRRPTKRPCGPAGITARRPRPSPAATAWIPPSCRPGTYRNMMGNQALAWGLVAAAQLSGKELFLGTYPITPASDILHELSKFKHFGVRTFQAEDEIAAICSTIGAAFGGAMAVTTTSGPGIALKGRGHGTGA